MTHDHNHVAHASFIDTLLCICTACMNVHTLQAIGLTLLLVSAWSVMRPFVAKS